MMKRRDHGSFSHRLAVLAKFSSDKDPLRRAQGLQGGPQTGDRRANRPIRDLQTTGCRVRLSDGLQAS